MHGDDDQHLGFGSELPVHDEEGDLTSLTAEDFANLPASVSSHFGMSWTAVVSNSHGVQATQRSLQNVTYSCVHIMHICDLQLQS